MGNLKRNVNRFFLRNRDKGIPNLMLWISATNLVVYLLSLFGLQNEVLGVLCFDAEKILHGQIWRLVSFMFVDAVGYSLRQLGLLFFVLFLYFYYWLGRLLENTWGTFRFNRYYFSGILLTSVAALLVYVIFGVNVIVMPYYINLSLFLAAACLIPEQRVLVFFHRPGQNANYGAGQSGAGRAGAGAALLSVPHRPSRGASGDNAVRRAGDRAAEFPAVFARGRAQSLAALRRTTGAQA